MPQHHHHHADLAAPHVLPDPNGAVLGQSTGGYLCSCRVCVNGQDHVAVTIAGRSCIGAPRKDLDQLQTEHTRLMDEFCIRAGFWTLSLLVNAQKFCRISIVFVGAKHLASTAIYLRPLTDHTEDAVL